MEDVVKDLQELKAHVSILTKDNSDNRAKIHLLETRLSASEGKVRELEAQVNTPPSGIAYDVQNHQSFKALKRKVVYLEQQQLQQQQQQQQQIQDANERFQSVDTLKRLLSGTILKNTGVQQAANQIGQIRSAVEDLQLDACSLSSKMDEVSSLCTAIHIEFEDLKSSLPTDKETNQAQTVPLMPAATPGKNTGPRQKANLGIKKDTPHNKKNVTTTVPGSVGSATTEHLFKVLVIGGDVGKKSFIQKYVHDEQPWATPRLGVDFAIKRIQWSSNTWVKLQLWDIAGQERFRGIHRMMWRGVHAGLIMFDLTNERTFHEVIKWKKYLDECRVLKDGSSVPCLLLANKCDVRDRREVSAEQTEEFCQKHGFLGWCETSIKQETRINENMFNLIGQMLKTKEMGHYQESP